MDPASLVVGALAAGTLAGTQDIAAASIKDVYAELKKLLGRKLVGHTVARTALEQHESSPDEWGPVLERELPKTDALADPAVLALAARLLDAIGTGTGAGGDTYVVDARKASRFQIGRGNVQVDGTPRPHD